MSYNDITGDKMRTKAPSEAYLSNYDLIFKKDRKVVNEQPGGTNSETPVVDGDKPLPSA